MREAVVLAGGEDPPVARFATWREALRHRPPALVVAADAGLALAAPLRLRVDLLVGDLDSVSSTDLASARAADVTVERHPVAKDATDLALALDAAVAGGAGRITVIGGGGGRADHELALWLLLGASTYADVRMRSWSPRATTDVVRPAHPATLHGLPGELCSLLPLHGPAEGVRTAGLRYPLHDEVLDAGSSRGVSNAFVATEATVTCRAGVLLAIRPGPPALGAD